ncbi:hypothetical protein ACVGOW_08860 [Pseudonocardia saturnea]
MTPLPPVGPAELAGRAGGHGHAVSVEDPAGSGIGAVSIISGPAVQAAWGTADDDLAAAIAFRGAALRP